jgi:hypothetical protein
VNPWRAEEISDVAIIPGWVVVLGLRGFGCGGSGEEIGNSR